MPIPERFVPPAFKEWGVELVDWQSQCAMNVTAEDGIYAKELRFLPTQGCEADASTVESAEERTVAAADVFPAAAEEDPVAFGSYSSGAATLHSGGGGGGVEEQVVEHCLAFDFQGKGEEDEPNRARVRVQQTLRVAAAEGAASVAIQAISAWKEFYYEVGGLVELGWGGLLVDFHLQNDKSRFA